MFMRSFQAEMSPGWRGRNPAGEKFMDESTLIGGSGKPDWSFDITDAVVRDTAKANMARRANLMKANAKRRQMLDGVRAEAA
jgi:hypothetical protein